MEDPNTKQRAAVLVTISQSGSVCVTAHSNIQDAIAEGRNWQERMGDNPNWIAASCEGESRETDAP